MAGLEARGGLLAALLAACAAAGPPSRGQPPAAAPAAPAPSIGVATIAADGTITLRLRSEDPATGVAEGLFTYPPGHPQYQAILQHVGPLHPGEQKPVRPFPPQR